MPTLYLGIHRGRWLEKFSTPVCVSLRTMEKYCDDWESHPKAFTSWILDSGAYTEISTYGEWRYHPDLFGSVVTRILDNVATPPTFCAPQDWCCEATSLSASGLTVAIHQALTTESVCYLRSEFSFIPWIPVVQGWELSEYVDHVAQYQSAGIDLTSEPLVGLGSVCRRTGTRAVDEIITTLHGMGIRLHGFGVHRSVLARCGHLLSSMDTMVLYPVHSCWWILISSLPIMRTAYEPGGWVVFRYELERPYETVNDPLLMAHSGLMTGLAERGRRHGQPFLIGPEGRPDDRVNAFFASPRMLSRSPLTWKKYAQSLGMWLNFLLVLGRRWDEATEEDAEYFKEWRLSVQSNPRLVEASTFAANLAGLRKFYRWAARRYGVADPVAAMDDFDLKPRGVRGQDVKWLDPAGYRRWRDLGMRGLGLDGRPDGLWRGRNEQRDAAFVDGLYSSGLRLTEWASVLLTDLPEDNPARGYRTCRLADGCAKGGYGHTYWIQREALLGVLDYVEGARARAVRNAQRAGLYERLTTVRLVIGSHRNRLIIQEPDGRRTEPTLNAIGPWGRRRLFRSTTQGLEPLAVWLNEDGMPRTPHGWQHTFAQANARIARLGLAGFSATPHMLRHSCALRWYSVGRLAYEHRFAHLTEEETRDFRAQFGDTWDLVATILGHRSPETTKQHYLEPFRALDVELLLQHAQQAAVERFLASYLAEHPRVLTDPIREAM